MISMILFISDVSGLSLDKKQHYQSLFGDRIVFVSPYDHLPNSADIVKNYQTFCELVGISTYVDIVRKQVEHMPEKPFIAIGESVGATALWCNTAMLNRHLCEGAYCLYGSRIRDHLDIQPSCSTYLIFSEDENYFLSASVKQLLSNKPDVHLDSRPLSHGFATPGHVNFVPALFEPLFKDELRLVEFDRAY